MRPILPLAPLLLMAGAGLALADADAQAGRKLFIAQCAYCHGEEARGNGPQASVLNPTPKDLTRLKSENGGVFPVSRVIFRIDGRQPLVAHGSPMPVFGGFFDGEDAIVQSETGQPILTSKPIADLVAWLASIQADEATP